ncbi:carboxypeptidase B-like protein, partial [Leptotrombidium deliense]
LPNYCGTKAFSENETIAIRDYVKELTKNQTMKIYFAMHSYSQIWLFPYSYKEAATSKDDMYKKLAKNATDAIRKTHNVEYTYGQSYTAMYPCSGTSMDWIEVNNLANFTFTIELRDDGTLGFILPSKFIKPTAEENWNGIKAVIASFKNMSNIFG